MELRPNFYEEEYGGDLIPVQHRQRLLKKAALWLEGKVNRDPGLRAEQRDAMELAVCAAADAFWKTEQRQGVERETNDSVTVAYSPTAGTPEQAASSAARPYLLGTGLLYCGVKKVKKW